MTTTASTTATRCRSCGGSGLQPFLDLGTQPLADALLTAEQLQGPEPRYPLVVAFCPGCSLVQITETVDPEELFQREYPYYSSFSPALLEHSRRNALELIERKRLGPGSLVVELASNDGYLLQNFVQAGIPVLGIDPAEGPARAARDKGVETLNDFFGLALARRLASERRRADVIVANNVLAHVADTNGFVAGLRELVADDGLVVIEVPYVADLIEHCEFDTIYHEHLCYFSLTALDKLFRRHGLFLNDYRHLPIHGGSLRLFVEPHERVGRVVTEQLGREREHGLDSLAYYEGFAERVHGVGERLRELLLARKAEGRRIAAYGAAAKGATLLNVYGIGQEMLEYVVDRNVHKHGRFMPGVHLPVRPVEMLLHDRPDDVLLLTWNFKDEILQQQDEYRRRGGTFIVPIPEPTLA